MEQQTAVFRELTESLWADSAVKEGDLQPSCPRSGVTALHSLQSKLKPVRLSQHWEMDLQLAAVINRRG